MVQCVIPYVWVCITITITCVKIVCIFNGVKSVFCLATPGWPDRTMPHFFVTLIVVDIVPCCAFALAYLQLIYT